MLEQLDIFGALAQAEAEAQAKRKLPVRDRFKIGDFVQGRLMPQEPLKRGWIESFTMSEALLIRHLSGGKCIIDPATAEHIDPPAQAEAEAEFKALVGEGAIAPQPEPAPEPAFTDARGNPLKVGDRIVYTLKLSDTDIRTLRGTIEGFEDQYWTAPVALVRVHPNGPLYPCGLRAVTLEGDRDGR